jgi:hypothetical protein
MKFLAALGVAMLGILAFGLLAACVPLLASAARQRKAGHAYGFILGELALWAVAGGVAVLLFACCLFKLLHSVHAAIASAGG